MNTPFVRALFLSFLLTVTEGLMAQVSLSNLRLSISPTEAVDLLAIPGADTLSNPLALASSVDYQLDFDISSLFNVDKILVKMGTSSGAYNVVNASFEEDGTSSAPYTMTMEEGHITMMLGSSAFFPLLYVEAKVQYVNGTFSNPVLLTY